jgi:nucleotide-binding universal stress UspA family protein
METLDEKVVTIARFSNSRALLLQSLLQAENIESFLSHQNLLQAAVSSGVEIKVRSSDVDRALRVIEQAKQDFGPQKEWALKSLKSVRKILVPIDFSEASSKASLFALDIADKLKAEIRLVHVYYNPVVDVAPFDTSHSYQVNLSSYLHEIEQDARKQMTTVLCEMRNKAKLYSNKPKISFSISNGSADEEIIAITEKYKPGLIVMGTHGMGHQSGDVLGSVTSRVIEKSDVPILAIPAHSPYNSLDKLKNVLFATDFDDYDQVALSKLIGLLHPFNVTLHCVHVSIGVKKSWDNVKMESLKEFIKTSYPKFPFRCQILVSDNIVTGIESYMREHDVELLAITNHARGTFYSWFTPNVTKMIMTRMNLPLFVFKAVKNS